MWYLKTLKTLDYGDLQFNGGSSDHRFCCSSFNEGRAIIEIVALVLYAVSGGGLSLAGMTNPSQIVNFLDIAGTWCPKLDFRDGGWIPVVAVCFLILKKLEKPLVFDDIQVPTHGVIDQRLEIGSVLFGIGRGVLGLCPGPAFASVLMEPAIIIPYLIALVLGSLAYDQIQR